MRVVLAKRDVVACIYCGSSLTLNGKRIGEVSFIETDKWCIEPTPLIEIECFDCGESMAAVLMEG